MDASTHAPPPPPHPSAAQKWWRRPLVRSNGIAAGTVLVVKMDSVGGNAPNEGMCDESQAGEMLYEYMTNSEWDAVNQ